MTLLEAAQVLDQLDVGRIPDLAQAARGLEALDPLLLRRGYEQDLHDAAASLELLVATGATIGLYVSCSQPRWNDGGCSPPSDWPRLNVYRRRMTVR